MENINDTDALPEDEPQTDEIVTEDILDLFEKMLDEYCPTRVEDEPEGA